MSAASRSAFDNCLIFPARSSAETFSCRESERFLKCVIPAPDLSFPGLTGESTVLDSRLKRAGMTALFAVPAGAAVEIASTMLGIPSRPPASGEADNDDIRESEWEMSVRMGVWF